MTRDSHDTPDLFDEVHTFVTASLEGALSADDVEDFERLLADSAEARRIYAGYIQNTLHLSRISTLLEAGGEVETRTGSPAAEGQSTANQPRAAGSLDRLIRKFRKLAHRAAIWAIAACVVVAVSLTWILARYGPFRSNPADSARQVAEGNPGLGDPNPPPKNFNPIASLAAGAGCRWNGATTPAINDVFIAGQSLNLASGVAEIDFRTGVRLILQGPAALQLLSASSVRLEAGKATVTIQSEAARGFQIVTADAVFVDQGTEFGVEVAPGGSSKIHVFKGEVDVDRRARQGQAAVRTQRLVENAGARLEPDENGMTLVQDTGECFIRSIDEADRDQHVVAYWRFEDRPVGILLPDTERKSSRVCATVDSSFSGNDLYVAREWNRPVFSADVAAMAVPQTGRPNHSCLDTSRPTTDINRLNVYTHSEFSHAAPFDAQQIQPMQWTIEASVKAAKLLGKPQGFLGRDGTFTTTKYPLLVPARLTFQINAQNRFAISFYDVAGRFHEAVADELSAEPGRWYHLAATSDGRVLRLYVDALDGRGYVERAATPLPADGSTALGKGADNAEWSIGRAGNMGDPADWLRFWGLIDEVRISDVARRPEEFLFAAKTGVAPGQERR